MASQSSFIQSIRIILMSSGALFIAILLSLSLRPLLTSAASELPSFWFSLSAWLKPPYLYVIINGIIITIAASSRFHRHAPRPEVAPHFPPKTASPSPQYRVIADQFSPYDAVSVAEVLQGTDSYYGTVSVKDVEMEAVKLAGIEEREDRIVEELKAPPVLEFQIPEEVEIGDNEIEESAVAADVMSTWTPLPLSLERQKPVMILPEVLPERPPALSRFAHHRRPTKASPAEGGKVLRRVAKPKRNETLEATWKAITEGRGMPLTRHLKKLETWENHSRHINLLDSSINDPTMKKSETFKDRANYVLPPVSSSRLKKEPSLSQDELNRRVEAFINKFNEEMRLQRQQSIDQFMDKINRI